MTNVAILGAGNIARQMAKTLRLMKARGDKGGTVCRGFPG